MLKNKLFINTVFANIFFSLVQWLLLITITKFGTSEDVGMFTYALSVTAPIVLLASLKYEEYISRQYLNETEKSCFILYRVFINLMAIVLFLIILFLIESDLFVVWVLFIVIVYKSLESLIRLKYSFLIQKNEIKVLNRAKIRRSILLIIFSTLVFISTKKLILFLISILLISLLDLFLLKEVRFYFNLKRIYLINIANFKKYFVRFIPFGLSLFLVSINANMTRYLANFTFGVEHVGYVATLSYFIIVGNMLVNSVYSITSYKMKQLLKNNITDFISMFRRYFLLVVVIGFLGVLCSVILGDDFLVFVYNDSFTGMNIEFILIMVTAFFLYLSSYFQHILTFLNYLSIQMWAVLIGLISQIIIFFLIMDVFGTLTIYLSYLFSAIVTSIMLFLVTLKKLYNLKTNDMRSRGDKYD